MQAASLIKKAISLWTAMEGQMRSWSHHLEKSKEKPVERLLLLVLLTWFPLHQGQTHIPVSLSVQMIAR